MGILSSELYNRVRTAAECAGVPMSNRRRKTITKQLAQELKGSRGDIAIAIYDKIAPYDHTDYVGATSLPRRAAR